MPYPGDAALVKVGIISCIEHLPIHADVVSSASTIACHYALKRSCSAIGTTPSVRRPPFFLTRKSYITIAADGLANFYNIMAAVYNKTGCLQSGAAPFVQLFKIDYRNVSLDNDPAACSAALSCNWDYFRTNATECASGGYRGSSLCGYCDSLGYCTEVRARWMTAQVLTD